MVPWSGGAPVAYSEYSNCISKIRKNQEKSVSKRGNGEKIWKFAIKSPLFKEKSENRKEKKLFFSKKIQNFRVLCLWVHILGASVRAQKLQYVANNIL